MPAFKDGGAKKWLITIKEKIGLCSDRIVWYFDCSCSGSYVNLYMGKIHFIGMPISHFDIVLQSGEVEPVGKLCEGM